MPGMGCGSVPKHGTEIVGILWRLYGLSVTVQNFSGCGFVLTYALNGCLVCIGPGMAVDCGFTK